MHASKTDNPGMFTSWHMERTAENKFSEGEGKQPAAGTRSKTLVTDGRPAGTHFRDNPWFDGGAGNRGARADELEKYEGSTYAKQSPNDAPFMKGDRARTKDGTLREVRGDQQIGRNKSLQEKAPELIKQFGGDMSVGELRQIFGGRSIKQITVMTQAERASMLGTDIAQAQLAAMMGILG